MSSLANFPRKSQLADIHEVNAAFDCVPTSIAACLQWLLGKPFDGGDIKDAVYGKDYKGATSAEAYIPYCKEQGVILSSINGTPAELVAKAHSLLAQQIPVVFTEVDPYVPASYGWTHVCAWHADNPGELIALDPYIGKDVVKSDQEWEAVLRFNQIWILEKENTNDMAIDIHSPDVSTYFEEVDGSHWHCKKTNKLLAYGMLSCYKATNGLVTLGLPLAGEISIENVHPSFAHLAEHSITIQPFERGILAYDPEHLIDRPPQSGNVYRLHLYDNGPGTDKRLWDMQAQIGQLQAQLQQEQHKTLPPDPVVAHKVALFDQIKTLANS